MNKSPIDFFSGKNFITPHILRYGWIEEGKVAFELSKGSGFTSDIIYGVSIRPDVNKKSECFGSKRDAESYIKELQTNC